MIQTRKTWQNIATNQSKIGKFIIEHLNIWKGTWKSDTCNIPAPVCIENDLKEYWKFQTEIEHFIVKTKLPNFAYTYLQISILIHKYAAGSKKNIFHMT